jgi:hypothetical protein
MRKTTVGVTIGIIVGLLGVIGLFAGEGRIMAESMNVDISLDIIRILLGGWLIYGSMRSVDAEKAAMEVFGVAYLAIFVLGIFSSNLFGLVPHGLGWLDQALHLVGGILGLWLVGALGTTGTRIHRA